MVESIVRGEKMKDFPMFTTEFGVASLVLKEVPYQDCAYIIIRDALQPEELLKECVSFCRMCGAEWIYATGHKILEEKPLYTALIEMRCTVDSLPDTDAALFPVQERTLRQWLDIYNQKIVSVPNGAWMTDADGRKMLERGDGYFVHRGDKLLGIGMADAETIHWVASVQPGAGRDVVLALAHAVTADTVTLTVASENKKALNLYENLGFLKTKEISRWYRVD